MTQLSGIITTGAQLTLDTLLVRPKRAIGDIIAQVTLEESHQDDIEITDHPVEQGAVISDHAFKRPAEVTIRGAWSNSPSSPGLIDGALGGLKATVTGAQTLISGKVYAQLNDIYASLLKLQKEAIPFTIYTGKRKYDNMLIKSLSVQTDKTTENELRATLVCREVQIVSTSILTVPTDTTRHSNPSATAAPVVAGTRSLANGAAFNQPNTSP